MVEGGAGLEYIGLSMRGLAFSLLTLLSAICSGPAQTISIAAPDPSASETGVDAGLFRISRTGDTTSPLTVSIVFSGTGSAGTDYEALSSTITIPAGQTSSDMVLNPINDGTVETADDSVTATLQSGVGYLVGAPASATVTIANNDAFDTTCPLLLSATATSSSNITITWTDNFQTGTKYRVRHSTDQTTWTGFDAAANATAHTFTGLTPGTVYYFEVRAERTTAPTASAWSNRVSTAAATPASTPAFSNLEQWRRLERLDGAARAGMGGSGDDPDGDTIPNLLEYALGGDPLTSDTPGLALFPDGASLQLEWTDAPDLLDVDVRLAESTDLVDWQLSPLTTSTTSGIRSATDSRTAAKRFYRLVVMPMNTRTPLTTITCWGDSLTAGTSSQPWPGQLAGALGGRTVHNGGIGSETSGQILARISGVALTSPAPAASTPAGTVLRLVASRVVPPRTVDTAYRAQWPAYSAAIANAGKVEFLNFGRKIGESSTPLAGNVTTNIATSPTRLVSAGHPFADGDIVHFSAASLPAPLVTGKPYFVRDADAAGLSLSESAGGSAVELTADSSAATTLTGPFVFDWTHPGGASSLSLRTHTDHDTHTTVFWMGRNNLAQPDRVIADLREAIAHLKSLDARFLVLSVLTQSTEAVGSTNYMHVQNLNAQLRTEYPDAFVDVRAALLRGGSGTGQDAIDRAADVIPTSLRTDTLHLNNAGNAIVAAEIAAAISARGW